MLTQGPPPTPLGSPSLGAFCPPQPHHPTRPHACSPPTTPTAQPPHKPARKALLPPTLPPQIPVSSIPGPWGLGRRRGKPLTGCAADAQAVWGGPWGGQRGRGDKKAEQDFCFLFFYILHREGCLRAGVPPQDHFPGTTRAQGPSPLPRSDPCPSCPREGSNPPQNWEAGQSGDGKRACRLPS